MQLKEYILLKRTSACKLADQWGISKNALYRCVKGEKMSARIAMIIVEQSEGKITYEEIAKVY